MLDYLSVKSRILYKINQHKQPRHTFLKQLWLWNRLTTKHRLLYAFTRCGWLTINDKNTSRIIKNTNLEHGPIRATRRASTGFITKKCLRRVVVLVVRVRRAKTVLESECLLQIQRVGLGWYCYRSGKIEISMNDILLMHSVLCVCVS